MRHSYSKGIAALVVLTVGLALPASAAEPSSGSVDGQKSEATWSGGPCYASNRTSTLGLTKQGPCDVGQPACDSYRLSRLTRTA